MSFMNRLRSRWRDADTLVCVGLDPLPERFPAAVGSTRQAIFEFNRAIVDATADLACAFKPQIAHYSALGAEGELERTIAHIRVAHPEVPVILDAKRGDVGSTAERYAREAFERYGADAVTLNPLLGFDSVQPFLEYADRGLVVLCKTSNPSSGDFQDLDVGGRKFYQVVAEQVATKWNEHGNCLLVVGATFPREMAELRRLVGDVPFLVPGVGAQGGDVAAVVENGCTADGTGLVISASRSILYADSGPDFAEAARRETERLRCEINDRRRERG